MAEYSGECLVKGLDRPDTTPSATGQVTEVPGLQGGVLLMESPGQGYIRLF